MRLITGRKLAKVLKCDMKTIYFWKEKGIIKPIGRIGPCDVYDGSVIEQLKKHIESHQYDKRYVRKSRITGVSEWFKKGKDKKMKG